MAFSMMNNRACSTLHMCCCRWHLNVDTRSAVRQASATNTPGSRLRGMHVRSCMATAFRCCCLYSMAVFRALKWCALKCLPWAAGLEVLSRQRPPSSVPLASPTAELLGCSSSFWCAAVHMCLFQAGRARRGPVALHELLVWLAGSLAPATWSKVGRARRGPSSCGGCPVAPAVPLGRHFPRAPPKHCPYNVPCMGDQFALLPHGAAGCFNAK